MSKISTYEVTPVPKLADKLIGTSVGGEIEDITYNFTLSELLNLFIPNIPANTLQGVLDYGNTATQDIILNGTIFTTYLEVTDTATILNSYLTEETHIAGSLYDRLDSAGTAGQVLRSTGTQVEWYSIPNVIPTLQQVLAAGNTADINIILSANIQALTATANNVVSNTSLSVNGTLKDKDASAGTAGQILSSTGTKVQWIALPVYTATSPLSIDSITRVISIQQASASQNGYLSSADWITFDGKQGAISLTTVGSSGPSTLVGSVINVPNYTLAGLGGVPQTRTLTINGVTYNLSADRSWTLATGVSSVSATTPLFSTGGVNPDISIQQSSSSLDGYLSNVDWLTFNSKQPAGNYITSLTGEATGAGPGAAAVTLSNAAVIGKLLTGLNITGGTVVSTDSILTAFGKVQNQINGLVGGVIYKGVWNAATNTPTLVSSVGVQGNYYIVNVAGNTNLNGITDWNVGDWAIFNGSTWNKVDNTDLVTSVNGQVGAVSLTTDNIPEGATNLYYLDSRARAALSFAAGSGAYNSTTGVITIPTDNSQILNGAGYITLVSLSASSPLSYNNITGAFSIQVANTTQNGYLSSTDWNTFNGKQPFLGGTGLVKSVAGTISYITDNSANWNTAYNDSIVSAAVTGTSTKTLTLTQQDAGTVTASWTDLGLTSVGVSMPSAFSVSGSPLTSNGTIAITGAGTTLQYIDGTGALQSFPSLTGYVPYTGATTNVNLGIYSLTAASLIKSGGTSSQFLKADGSVDSSAYIVLGSLSATAPLSYNSTTGVFTISQAGTASNGYLSSTDWNTFNDKQPLITAGTTLQYYRGDKTFQTLNTTVVPEGTNLYYLDSRARAAVSLTTVGSSGASTYNSTTGVFNIPDYGAALTGYVPTSRTLNINGTSYDLSADRSWSVGTVTSVAALTLGTTGTDLSSSVATGTTTPVITLNVPTASAANRGALSAADWSTFNTKVGGVTATSPLFSSGGSTPNITIQQSSGSQAGYLSAADWTTFNNKQVAGNYITSLTGEATATGPGAAAVTLDNAAVTGKILTGVNITGGTVLATDTMLTAFGKLQNQVNGLIGGSIYQGTWNAATNTPTLTSSVGTQGYYYIVSVAGTTNLDGITDWFVGDWAIFNGGVWQQVDNTDAVVSVNGQTGAVSLTTDNISEGVTNLYYTDTRARAALSFAAGSGAYNSTTGVITIPTNTSQLTNGANFITLASLSGTAPISYNSGTGAISITQSGTASNGYLSSTDWNTFNNKQSALTNPVLASGSWTSNYIPKINGTYTITNSLLYDGGSSIGVNTNAPYDSTQFKLDINGGLLIKNTSGVAAQITMIDANPASGGNAGFSVQSVGGTLIDSWYQLQTYYGTSIAGGALRLQPNTGQILVGSTAVSAFKVDITGTLRLSGQLTLGSTITNGTYTYTLPGATGTLALTSALTGYVTLDTTQTITGQKTISRLAAAYGGTTQSFLIDGAAGNGALTINAAADYAYLSFAQAGVSKFEMGAEGAATNKGSLYINHNVQTGSTGAAVFIKKSNGYVGILNVAPTTALDVTGAGTFSSSISAYSGEIIIQSAAINNSWVGNNMFYDGVSFKYKANGYAQALYFDGSDFEIRVANTGLTGASITWIVGLRILSVSGNVETPQDFTANKLIKSGGTSSQYLMADGSVSTLSNPVTGTGTTNYLPKFTGTSTIGNSIVFDNGSAVGVNTNTPTYLFNVSQAADVWHTAIGDVTTTGQMLRIGGNASSGATKYATLGSYLNNSGNTGSLLVFNRDGGNVIIGGSSTVSDSGDLFQVKGNVQIRNNYNGLTRINIVNTTAGASSYVETSYTTDAAGNASIGKYSTTTTAYKFISASSSYIYNGGSGNLAIINDFATGAILLGAGGSSTAHLTITSGGLVGIGVAPTQSAALTFADSLAQKILFNNNANNYRIDLASAVAGGDAMIKFIAGSTGAGEVGFYTTTNLRMLITSGGNVIIGTTNTSTAHRLTVYSATETAQIRAAGAAPAILFTNTDTNTNSYSGYVGIATAVNNFMAGTAAGDMVVQNYSGYPILFGIGNVIKMRIEASGQLVLTSTISNGTYTYTLPSATGTLALTSDIPSLTGYVTLATAQTITGEKTISRLASSYGGTVQSFLIDGAAGNGALTINSASAYAYLNFAQAGTTKMEIGIVGTAGVRYGSLYINRNIQSGETGASIMVKKSDGYVGINNLDPAYQLDVNGTGRFITSLTIGAGASQANIYLNRSATTSVENAIRWQTNGTSDWYLGSAASGANSDLEFYNYGIGAVNFKLTRSTGAATFSSSVNAGGLLTINVPTDNTTVGIFHAGGGTANRGLKISTFASVNDNAGVRLDAQTTVGGATLVLATAGTDRLTIASTGAATFSSSISAGSSINATAGFTMTPQNTSLYSTDGALSYYATTNGVYLNGAGTYGWLRLQASGAENDRTAINLWGASSSQPDTIQFRTAAVTRFTIGAGGGAVFTGAITAPSIDITNNTGGITMNRTSTGNYSTILYQTGGAGMWYVGMRENNATSDYIIFNAQTGENSFRVKISNGFTSVGNLDPVYKFNVYTDADVWHTAIGGASGQLRIGGQTGTGAVIQAYTPAGVTRNLYIQRDGGNVSIGTSSDTTHRLTVNSSTAAGQVRITGTAPTVYFTNTLTDPATYVGLVGLATQTNNFFTGTAAGDFVMYNSASGYKLFVVNYSGGVYLTSGATSWTANSDIRLKNINSHIENAVEKLSTLQTINFSYKNDKFKKQNLGLIAQEVEKIFPELIDKNNEGMLGVRYTELVPVLIKAIQELKLEIETLKNK